MTRKQKAAALARLKAGKPVHWSYQWLGQPWIAKLIDETRRTDGPPVIDAYGPLKGGDWEFYCQYCRRKHAHGVPDGPDIDGGLVHRINHCWNPNSPYRTTDYFLRHAGERAP
jgi:hypothetical protein